MKLEMKSTSLDEDQDGAEDPAKVTTRKQQVKLVYHSKPPPGILAFSRATNGYKREKYCGKKTLLFGICLPCLYWCPCDERTVYTEPETGRRIIVKL
mmetsp:Transcript_4059/g.5957  ORF Transcript_4059/g.5957 Transcript_4059/m.5957 type:complete len:97 (-) Transcript_4059:724-1014(-)|eukprot:CAMPEP_0203756928 /NCGR_PEP_ID=MMETSP0098-20131031/10112_1 /ASSEMBLY_ACC=CAM_ASM_000208 /TAXON_ID=96639 /ORGANISM=" , Strain NY0313808BC1" /LENGTH=96 /DNA_ID=CAMNT_0050648985 /DNA_START=678 /DNA_END=968 /DNA_ORIENTATION=+